MGGHFPVTLSINHRNPDLSNELQDRVKLDCGTQGKTLGVPD